MKKCLFCKFRVQKLKFCADSRKFCPRVHAFQKLCQPALIGFWGKGFISYYMIVQTHCIVQEERRRINLYCGSQQLISIVLLMYSEYLRLCCLAVQLLQLTFDVYKTYGVLTPTPDQLKFAGSFQTFSCCLVFVAFQQKLI